MESELTRPRASFRTSGGSCPEQLLNNTVRENRHMFDEKTIQEVAKAAGKALDVVKGAGGFLDDILGRTFRELGAIPADWARLLRLQCLLLVGVKTKRLLDARGITAGQLRAIDPHLALPLFDGASLEGADAIQDLWAALIANSVDPERCVRLRKIFIEVLRSLEPVDARVLQFLSEPSLDERYTILTGATVNADVIAREIAVDAADVKVSLQTLARYQCVVDSWEGTLHGLDFGYSGFRVDNPKANFRLSHLGTALTRAISPK